jgi:Tol biopolymer transport system component
MRAYSIAVLGCLLLGSFVAAGGRLGGKLLVENTGTLLLIAPEGSQTLVAKQAIAGVLSPDGEYLAFITGVWHPQPAAWEQKLVVKALPAGPESEIIKLTVGSYFQHLEWMPEGRAVAYDAVVPGRSDDLFVVPVLPAPGQPRKLGEWYQGISFSPDGSRIVHAVNGPESPGLEAIELASGKRTMIHRTKGIVWDARYSPDGKYIAYSMTIRNPPLATDEEPDCGGPTLGLWIYSFAEHNSAQVVIRAAPTEWDNVKNFALSPDGRRIAVTQGTTDCDYPGSGAGVFLTDVEQKQQLRISTSILSVEPAFSADGTTVAFVDVSESRSKLMLYEIGSRSLRLLSQASEQTNHYTLLDWK